MVFVVRHVYHGDILVLGVNRTYTLGRSNANSILLKDRTVNRHHAKLETSASHVDIEDCESNHGTWINKQRIVAPFRLRNGDVIVFGKKDCKYVFLDPNFTSMLDETLSAPTKSMLRQTLKDLDIQQVRTFSNSCTHYVIETVSLNILKEKTILHFLIDRKTVITPKYFVDMLTNIIEAPLIPNVYRYMPELDSFLKSKGIDDIAPRKNRKYIFENLGFVFFDLTCCIDLVNLITNCGGYAIMYVQKETYYEELFEQTDCNEYIAVHEDSDGNIISPSMHLFLRQMKQHQKRVSRIQADDIYVSILKGDLIGRCAELTCDLIGRCVAPLPPEPPENEPQPCSSKTPVLDLSDSSDVEDQSIQAKVTRTPTKRTMKPLTSFSRLAKAYKLEKSLRDTVLQNHAKSPTLNRWIKRNGTNDTARKASSNEDDSSSSRSNNPKKNISKATNNNRDENTDSIEKQLTSMFELTDDETQEFITKNANIATSNRYYRATKQSPPCVDKEKSESFSTALINDTSFSLKESPTFVTNKKNVRFSKVLCDYKDTENYLDDSPDALKESPSSRKKLCLPKVLLDHMDEVVDNSPDLLKKFAAVSSKDCERDPSSIIGKRKCVVVNPFAAEKNQKRVGKVKNGNLVRDNGLSTTKVNWLQKFKNVDISPVT